MAGKRIWGGFKTRDEAEQKAREIRDNPNWTRVAIHQRTEPWSNKEWEVIAFARSKY